jgi:hypothetical protein
MPTRDDVLRLDRRGLHALLRDGHPIDPRALDDTVYRGISLGLPAWVDRVAWKTFQKVFHRDPATGLLRGWNVRVEQHGVDAASVPVQRDGAPLTFGHFLVTDLAAYRVPHACGAGLMLDYGRGGNAAWDVTRVLRDPIVAIEPGRTDLLLGWSYLDLAGVRVGTPSFFTLDHEGPLDHRAAPPRRA